MSKSEQTPQSLITRTLRAAIKVGDDYYTIEETIALPPSASDEHIAQAVDTGLRMYEAQRVAVEQQIRSLREHAVGQPVPVQIREPDAPASEKQRSYMDYLLKELNWDHERLAAFAAERMLNLLTLTKREASELIDEMKALATGTPVETAETTKHDVSVEEHEDAGEPEINHQPILPIGERATQRQVRALERLVEERGIDFEGELGARFGGRPIADLSMDEAGQLLSEWQQRPRQLRPAATRRAA
jgi:hypothetical protein